MEKTEHIIQLRISSAWFGKNNFRSVKNICCDMWDPYIKAIIEYHDKSIIVFYKFHIKKHISEAVDKVRKAEHKELLAIGIEDLKETKDIWLKNPENLTKNQKLTFECLRKKELQSLRAYEYKELFNYLWDYSSNK